jgi:hypothetical protein
MVCLGCVRIPLQKAEKKEKKNKLAMLERERERERENGKRGFGGS